MENTIYYIYSTISQTLAAMVALLGVFSIYMLQSLNNKFIDISQGYLDHLINLEKEKNPNTGIWFTNRDLSKLIVSKHYQGIVELMEREFKTWGNFSSEMSNYYSSIKLITANKKRVIKKTVQITMSSLVIILGSIITLSMASKIYYILFWILFLLFISAIAYVFWLIFNLIKFSLSSDL